jgi:hypothetical protein
MFICSTLIVSAAEHETFPPELPGGKVVLTDSSPRFLESDTRLVADVTIAKTPPTVDLLIYPGQDYPGEPWSNWGDGSVSNGKYYSAIGDHLARGIKGDGTHGVGNAIVYEYDPQTKVLREICNSTDALKLCDGHYTPGKVHTRIEMGSDGFIYFATHRGSEKATSDANRYEGDWILRCDPTTGKTDIVAHAPVPKHAIPTSILDPDRLIFYGGTAAGANSGDDPKHIEFFAWDVKNNKLLCRVADGPARYLMLARSTGTVYYTAGNDGKNDGATLMAFHPEKDKKPRKVDDGVPGLRAATDETPDGKIYAVSQKGPDGATLWSLDTKTEKIIRLGPAAAGEPTYITSIDADPTGRYLYYVPGAHGKSPRGGSAVIQYDTKTDTKKIIAFLEPFYSEKYGFALKGTFSTALSEDGSKLYITWNASRGSRHWDCCVLTVVHIPASERPTGERASLQSSPAESRPALRFEDVSESTGLREATANRRVHGIGWGDYDNDGDPDAYVATFAQKGGEPNTLLRNDAGKFVPVDMPAVETAMRGTGVVFADLDNDGDLDLYAASMPKPNNNTGPLLGSRLYRNDAGRFLDISKESGACPEAFGGRSACVVDYDGDGRLDLLVGEEPMTGYNGSKTRSTRLFRNLGGLKFVDASLEAGIPEGIPARGVAAGDVNGDTWPDLFLASNDGGNVLLINDGKGRFRKLPGGGDLFEWKSAGGDNMICGVTFGDINADGRLDLVLGQHYDHPWREPVANRLYLNRGNDDKGYPKFEDVTERVGLTPIPIKAPHVEVQDFDNDGLADIYTSVVFFDGETPHPLIFRQHPRGEDNGDLPRFEAAAFGVNGFPTTEDKAIKSSGKFFDKVIADRKVFYAAPAPTADFDGDGRLDMIVGSWWPEAPTMLLRNRTEGGGYIDIVVRGPDGVNRMGVGSRVNVYKAGRLGDAGALIASREIAVGYGYASGQEAVVHVGLGDRDAVDVEVVLPCGAGRVERKAVGAGQRWVVEGS